MDISKFQVTYQVEKYVLSYKIYYGKPRPPLHC